MEEENTNTNTNTKVSERAGAVFQFLKSVDTCCSLGICVAVFLAPAASSSWADKLFLVVVILFFFLIKFAVLSIRKTFYALGESMRALSDEIETLIKNIESKEKKS